MSEFPVKGKSQKEIVKSMRLTQEQYEYIQKVAGDLSLTDTTLMRVGTIMLLKQIEEGTIDWTDFYKYAATT